MTAVADYVHHDVATEALAIVHRELRAVKYGFRVVRVHVENRYLDHLRDIGAVKRRPRFGGRCRKADLVIDDDVKRAACGIAFKLRKVQGFGHHPLPRKRRVTVQDDRHDALARRIPHAHLLRLGAPLNNRVHRFEM